jgi:two-component sensor histidine kinase
LAADCAPVLFADPTARIIGAAHGGWRGTLAGVMEATVAAMAAQGAVPSRIRAGIGPCIAQPSYEVGPEFPAPFNTAWGFYFLRMAIAAFTTWSAPMRKRVRARRALAFDRAQWLKEGDSRSVERIARNLRPGVLDQLGLEAVLRDTSREFAARTSVDVKLALVKLTVRLPGETELTLYRILQDALRNVEQHAGASHVTVRLTKRDGFIQLAIRDDGVGFDSGRDATRRKALGGLGLVGMRERAAHAGGTLGVKSTRRSGTEIQVRIPVSPRAVRAS